MKILVFVFAAFCFVLWGQTSFGSELRAGWTEQIPYQYLEIDASGQEALRGFDISILRVASRLAGQRVDFQPHQWSGDLTALTDGQLDVVAGVAREESREAEVWFSAPYRSDSAFLFGRQGEAARWIAASPLESLRALRNEGGSLAIEENQFYGQDVEAFLNEPFERPWVVKTPNAAASLEELFTRRVDAILADRLAGPRVAWDIRDRGQLAEIAGPLYESERALMFSKETVTPEMVAAYNRALETLAASGEIERISRNTLVPHLMMITLGSGWFSLLDFIGTIAFAISGVLIARRERYDIIGATVLAFLPAFGGGILRDLICGRSPIGLLRTPDLVLAVIGTVLVGFVFYRIRDRFQKPGSVSKPTETFRWRSTQGLLEVTDALGLATFTIIGVMVAVEQNCEPLWLWGPIMACLTGAGGGVLRDILRAQADIPTLKGSVYPEIALVGGFFYSVAIIRRNMGLDLRELTLTTIFIVCAVFVTRLLVVKFGVRSLFLGRAKSVS